MSEVPTTILRVENLTIEFDSARERSTQRAVSDVTWSVAPGRTLALVGESGSGKSVSTLSVAQLLPQPPARVVDGKIQYAGRDLLSLANSDIRKIRGSEIAYIFQDPSTSLNPVLRIRTQMAEVLRKHRPSITDIDREIIQWLYRVGIIDPEKRLHDYPHQLSGGMQQRVMIAMALCGHPKILIADEPTTALDVTTQAQILDLLAELQSQLGMSIILITHNFAIVKKVAHDVAVMYRGRVVESGSVAEVLESPRHPYTKALIDCIPRLGQKRHRLTTIDHEAIRKFEEKTGQRAENSPMGA